MDPWVRKTPWRRAQQPTPVFLPGESRGPGRLEGCRPGVAKSQTGLKQLSTQHTPLFVDRVLCVRLSLVGCCVGQHCRAIFVDEKCFVNWRVGRGCIWEAGKERHREGLGLHLPSASPPATAASEL